MSLLSALQVGPESEDFSRQRAAAAATQSAAAEGLQSFDEAVDKVRSPHP